MKKIGKYQVQQTAIAVFLLVQLENIMKRKSIDDVNSCVRQITIIDEIYTSIKPCNIRESPHKRIKDGFIDEKIDPMLTCELLE